MPRLTWNDLAVYTDTIPEEYRNLQVFACVDGEFYLVDILESLEDDILDDGHPYLEVDRS